MSKRFGIIICLFLAGILGLLVWGASGSREPVFEGRSLQSWLANHLPSSAANPAYDSPGFRKADQALRAIGTNAIQSWRPVPRDSTGGK